MQGYLTISELAQRIEHDTGKDCPPRLISDLFYRRRIPGGQAKCPVIAGRRLIPDDFAPTVIQIVLNEMKQRALPTAAA